MTRVGLVFGGRSVEHLVSVNSARTVRDGLVEAGFDVVPLGISEDGCFLSVDESQSALASKASIPAQNVSMAPTLRHLLDAKLDVAFPIVHGTFGEDGTLQGLFEMMDLPYVGASVATSAVCMDKLLCKNALSAAGLAVVEHQVVRRREFRDDPQSVLARFEDATFPLFVKPAVGGSSVGCRAARTLDELKEAIAFAIAFDATVLVERAVKGRELEVSVVGHASLEASVVGEIVPAAEFYDYKDKYIDDAAGLLAPAPLDESVADHIRSRAIDAFAAVQGSGMARVDFFLEGEGDVVGAAPGARLFVNEINTLPGFTRISMYPKLWGLSGRPLRVLCRDLVEAAFERHQERAESFSAIHAFVEQHATST